VVYANYSKLLLKDEAFKEYTYKSSSSSIKLNDYSKAKISSGFNFNLFEFVMFLLQKVGFSFKNKIFDRSLKLKRALSFLCALKYFNYKFIRVRPKYNFLLYYLAVLLKSVFYTLRKFYINIICKVRLKGKMQYKKRTQISYIFKEAVIPLNKLFILVEYGKGSAVTPFGILGIKTWLYYLNAIKKNDVDDNNNFLLNNLLKNIKKVSKKNRKKIKKNLKK